MMAKTFGLVLLGSCVALAATTTNTAQATPFDAVTEWRIPFLASQPFQITVSGPHVFYLTNSYDQHLGRLDTSSNQIVEWPLPFVATSPGDIRVRPHDGAIFMTGGASGEIGQFDAQTQELRRWLLPVHPSNFAIGPSNLAIDELGRVLFSILDLEDQRTFIGRLDTATGATDMWSVPQSVAELASPRLTYVGGGALFFNVFGYGSGGIPAIVRLDTGTGIFTSWGLAHEPAYALDSDDEGNIYFQEALPGIARLNPTTGRLTEWKTPGETGDFMTIVSGHVFTGRGNPDGLLAIDTDRHGAKSLVTSTSTAPVIPSATVLTPTLVTLVGQNALAPVSHRLVRRRISGAMTSWPIAGAPLGVAAGSANAVFFVESVAATIARLTP